MAHFSLCGVVTKLVEAVGQLQQHALMFVVGHIIGQYPQLGCTVIPTLWIVKFHHALNAVKHAPMGNQRWQSVRVPKGSYDSHRLK